MATETKSLCVLLIQGSGELKTIEYEGYEEDAIKYARKVAIEERKNHYSYEVIWSVFTINKCHKKLIAQGKLFGYDGYCFNRLSNKEIDVINSIINL